MKALPIMFGEKYTATSSLRGGDCQGKGKNGSCGLQRDFANKDKAGQGLL